MVVAAAVAVGVAGFALWTRSTSAPETVALSPELVRQQAMSDADLRQELIERGAIPSGTAAVSSELLRQQAMSDAELRQELIERGLIPSGSAVPRATSGADLRSGITPSSTNVREAP
jgi:hypothetical protein